MYPSASGRRPWKTAKMTPKWPKNAIEWPKIGIHLKHERLFLVIFGLERHTWNVIFPVFSRFSAS